MDAHVGDRIIVESEGVGKGPREGEVVEIIEHPTGAQLRVRWSNGHESTYFPSAGAARILPREPANH
jgi:hypothetical protein